MKEGINRVILLGNVGVDPELKHGQNGSAVLRLRLATSERWKDKQSGDQKEATEWHTVIFFGNRAEGLAKHISKGDGLYIEGSVRTRQWETKEGEKRYTTEIVGRDLRFVGGGSGSGGGQRKQHTEQRGQGYGTSGTQASDFGADDFGEDSIPF